MFRLENLKNKHTPVIPMTPNFYWDEVLQNNLKSEKTNIHDFNFVDNPGIMRNIIIQATMMQELRNFAGYPININSWYRPKIYNDIVLPDNGYHSSPTSDHLGFNSMACDVALENQNKFDVLIEKWKNLCMKYDVGWSIGVYDWGLHLGWRRHKGPRAWGKNWWK